MDEMTTEPKTLHDIPSDIFLQPQLYRNINFKSLLALGTKNSLEEIRRLRGQTEYLRKNILWSFAKATAFEKRPRRRLNQNKASDDKSNETISNLSKTSNPELNIHKSRLKLAKETGFINFYIQMFGKKIRNQFKKEVCEPQLDIQKEEFVELKSGSKSECDWNKNESENILKSFQKLNIDEAESESLELTIKPGKMDMSENCSESNNLNSDSSTEREKLLEKVNDIQTLDTDRQLDFSSGDDPKNCATFRSDENCKSGSLIVEDSENLSSKKRSVQWNGEVDVVYYAGDSDGGKFVGREREPLREEADQQARNKKFIEKKNLLSKVSVLHFCDSGLVAFPK